jgi:DNA repair protein RecO (recombination protein O)
MPPVIDQAVVLRRSDYSESSQIVTLFTAATGLLRLIGKGLRRGTKARFAVGLDLLELGEAAYLPPHGEAGLGILTEWVQRDSFPGLRRALLPLYGGLYAVELTGALTQELDPHPQLFVALLRTLRLLADAGPSCHESRAAAAEAVARDALSAIVAFQRDLLEAIGYAPDLSACTQCRRSPRPDEVVYFSASSGGLVCRDCDLMLSRAGREVATGFRQRGAPRAPRRRMPPALYDASPMIRNAAWFDLLDAYLAHVAARAIRVAAWLRPLVHAAGRRHART